MEIIVLLVVLCTFPGINDLCQIGKVQLHVDRIAGAHHHVRHMGRHRNRARRIRGQRKRESIIIDGRCHLIRDPVIERDYQADFLRLRIHLPIGDMSRNHRRAGIIGRIPVDILRPKYKSRFVHLHLLAMLLAGERQANAHQKCYARKEKPPGQALDMRIMIHQICPLPLQIISQNP